MGKRISEMCVRCRVKRFVDDIKEQYPAGKEDYLRKAEGIIANAGQYHIISQLNRELDANYKRFFGVKQYSEEKFYFNELMLKMTTRFNNEIKQSKDPLLTALKLCIMGNYIDYGMFKSIDENTLETLLTDAENQQISNSLFSQFEEECLHAKNLLYITDNCGEIVLDHLFIQQIAKKYPNLTITVMVKGGEALNDATLVDVEQIGLSKQFTVVDTGVDCVGVPLELMSEEKKSYLTNADVIISKGQANAETLFEEGFNIYYALLCKCDHFAQQLHQEKMRGIFCKEIH